MTVRLATVGDARAIAAVNLASWRAAYRDQLPAERLAAIQLESRVARWRSTLEAVEPPARAVYVADLAGEVVGYAYVAPSRDEGAAPSVGEVIAIYVHPKHWSAGAGRDLMSAAVSSLRSAGFATASLWVLADNARAIRFYERAGWHADGAEQAADLMGVQLSEVRYTTEL